MFKHIAPLALCATLLSATPALAAEQVGSASGQGKIYEGRTFSLSAKIYSDGTADGRATLINKAFGGDSGPSPYRSFIDISCANVLPDGTVIFGGYATRTNDSNLKDAVFFAVKDNGEPGAGKDMVSSAVFWDDDPTTEGDPMACLVTDLATTPLFPIETGNINVKLSESTALEFRKVN